MSDGPTIREASGADVASLAVIRSQAIEAAFSSAYDRSAFADLVGSTTSDIEAWIAEETVTVLVVEDEVTVAAFGALQTESGELLGLYTAPHYQGRGCATRLIEHLENRARANGVSSVSVEAPTTAEGFFSECGFDVVGPTQFGGVEGVHMSKWLRTP